MKVTDAWMLAAVPACLVACATAPEHPREVVDVPLAAAPGNLGEVGTASLARRGDETSVVITISGVSPPVTRPLRLYAFIYPGTCGKLTATPVVSMNQTRRGEATTGNGPLRLHRDAQIPLENLRSGDYALVVRSAPWDGSVDLFCGNLKAARVS
ncbi:hypothetical protein ASL20_24635 [Cupriavidus necator]|uniref:hypothetical protein n=1 Tax=Cupriavidus necator TaxID=106590 RepID=UPI00073C4F5B|nr:hypothetical protein [Cupriavidus necator]KUE86340.1 hypothetical protein ASL20_24635 [Cupriavidus necator]